MEKITLKLFNVSCLNMILGTALWLIKIELNTHIIKCCATHARTLLHIDRRIYIEHLNCMR